MLINAYDTTVGTPFRLKDDVNSIIKTLHLGRGLVPTKKEGVFCITQDTNTPDDLKVFSFPITLQSHTRKLITVYDERPYRNDNNQVTNSNEQTIIKLAAFMQQDVADGNLTPMQSARLVATKAFTESVAGGLITPKGLDLNEALTLKVLLAYYFIGLQEKQSEDVTLISINVIRTFMGSPKDYVLGVIEHLPKLDNLPSLLKVMQTNPILYKLKSMGLKELIGVVSSISFAALGPKIIGCAAEAPCLFTAMVYGACRFRVYNRFRLGSAVDPKFNKNFEDALKSFTQNIDYTYNLNG